MKPSEPKLSRSLRRKLRAQESLHSEATVVSCSVEFFSGGGHLSDAPYNGAAQASEEGSIYVTGAKAKYSNANLDGCDPCSICSVCGVDGMCVCHTYSPIQLEDAPVLHRDISLPEISECESEGESEDGTHFATKEEVLALVKWVQFTSARNMDLIDKFLKDQGVVSSKLCSIVEDVETLKLDSEIFNSRLCDLEMPCSLPTFLVGPKDSSSPPNAKQLAVSRKEARKLHKSLGQQGINMKEPSKAEKGKGPQLAPTKAESFESRQKLHDNSGQSSSHSGQTVIDSPKWCSVLLEYPCSDHASHSEYAESDFA